VARNDGKQAEFAGQSRPIARNHKASHQKVGRTEWAGPIGTDDGRRGPAGSAKSVHAGPHADAAGSAKSLTNK